MSAGESACVSRETPPARACECVGVYIPPRTHTRSAHAGPRPIAEVLEEIASRLRHLGPDRLDPHKFHETKSELVAELRRLARRT